MKYALIGCGRIAKNHMKAAISNNLEIVAVCDIIEEKMTSIIQNAQMSKEPAKYRDYREMVTAEKPELVSIATESGKHAGIALFCIEQGIHVIIEKPMAMSMKDADRIVSLAKEKGVKVSACHQNRFNLAIQELRKAVEEKRFGRISHATINVRWNRDRNYYLQAPWRGTWSQDGGALMNQCIHGIDLLRWMMGGDVDEIFGATRKQFHHYLEAEDLGMALVKFGNGTIATIEGTNNVYPKNLEETLYVFGEKGTVKIGGTSANRIEVWEFEDEREEDSRIRGLTEEVNNVYGNGHISLFNDVINAIKEDREPYVNAQAGRDALEMVLAIYKSQKEGINVSLPIKDFSSLEMKEVDLTR